MVVNRAQQRLNLSQGCSLGAQLVDKESGGLTSFNSSINQHHNSHVCQGQEGIASATTVAPDVAMAPAPENGACKSASYIRASRRL